MAVLLYQLAIVVTLVLTRVVAPDRLSTAALVWTGLTLLNLFWPPLIILQLLVIWGTFALLNGRRQNSGNVGSESGQPKSDVPTASATQASSAGKSLVSILDHIDTAAKATSRSIESAASGLDMLDKSIKEAKTKQIERQKIEVEAYIRELQEKYAEESAQRQKALEKDFSSDPEMKRLYIETYNQQEPVVQRIKERIKARHAQNKVHPQSPPVSLSHPSSLSGPEQAKSIASSAVSKQQPKPEQITRTDIGFRNFLLDFSNFLHDLEEDNTEALAKFRKRRANRLANNAETALIGSANATVGSPAQARKSSSLPDIARQEIMETVIALKIPLLLHFTRARNLETILKYGLCSNVAARELGITPYTNDLLRLDGHPDAISLSISFPNYKMFYKYRQEEPDEEWAVLMMPPSILWQKKCAFCQRNAADHRIRHRPVFDLMNAAALRGMFEELEGIPSRQEQRLESYDPTDPQAEVLVFETIEPNWLECVGFESDEVMSKYSHLMDDQRMWRVGSKNRGIFASRNFVRKAYN